MTPQHPLCRSSVDANGKMRTSQTSEQDFDKVSSCITRVYLICASIMSTLFPTASSSDAGRGAASPKPSKRKPSKTVTPLAKKPATRKRKVGDDKDEARDT